MNGGNVMNEVKNEHDLDDAYANAYSPEELALNTTPIMRFGQIKANIA